MYVIVKYRDKGFRRHAAQQQAQLAVHPNMLLTNNKGFDTTVGLKDMLRGHQRGTYGGRETEEDDTRERRERHTHTHKLTRHSRAHRDLDSSVSRCTTNVDFEVLPRALRHSCSAAPVPLGTAPK